MKKLLIVLIVFSSAVALRAEYLFLTDGSIIKCKVWVEEVSQVTVLEEDNHVRVYPRVRVLRILYTEMNMGKIYVRLKSGGSILAYQVDEDRDSYTFRKEIDKPDEFKVMRADVLFMAERNPSSLKGVPATDEIALSWFRPYDPMATYRIYWKKNIDDQFEVAETIDGMLETYTMKNLPSNSRYYIRITGVDHLNEETLPSNEIQIITKNIGPGKPIAMRMERSPEGNHNVKWEPAVDPDGSIKEYRIFINNDNRAAEIGRTSGCSYELVPEHKSFSFSVSALDDKGDESGRSTLRGVELQADVQPAYLVPMSAFGEVSENGYGMLLSLTATDNFFYKEDISAGLETGYFYIPGKHEHLLSMDMVPFVLYGGYRYRATGRIFLKPTAGLGFAWLSAYYLSRGTSGLETLKERNRTGLNLLFRLGARAEYALQNGFIIAAGLQYGLFAETAKLQHYTMFYLGGGMLF